uniref:Uncharacterized protein n=1 Tax=Parascaris equorum TaxID=6256 RepID=A0A914RV38_PAREQ
MPWSRDIVDLRYLKLLHFASQLKAGRGLSIAVAFIRGNPLSIQDRSKAEEVILLFSLFSGFLDVAS